MVDNGNIFFKSVLMVVCDQTNNIILDVNDNLCELTGFGKQDLIGVNIADFITRVPNEKLSFRPRIDSKNDSYWHFKTRNNHDLVIAFSSQYFLFHGTPAILMVLHDHTNEILAQQINKNQLTRPLYLPNTPTVEINWDGNLNILKWQRDAELKFGWSMTDIFNSNDVLATIVFKSDLAFVRRKLDYAIRKKNHFVLIKNRNISKAGKIINCRWYNYLYYDDAGNLKFLHSIIEDITQLSEMQDKLRKSFSSYIDLINSVSDAIYLLDENGIILEVNKGFERLFGYKQTEVLGEHFEILGIPRPDTTESLTNKLKLATQDTNIRYEGSARRKDGKIIPTEVSLNVGSYLDYKVYIVLEQDITNRKKIQEELAYRESLFTRLFSMSPVGVAMIGTEYEALMVNKGFENIFGYTDEEIKGKELDKLIAIKNEYYEAKILSGTTTTRQYRGVRRHKDGRAIEVMIYAVPIFKGEEHMVTFGIYMDMTESIQDKKKIEKSLKEKEILLSEIHHRVKNNLAIISGLLELQSYQIKNKEALEILSASQTRINSIALVHEKLYMSDDLSEINMKNYIEELAHFVADTLKPIDFNVKLHLNIEEIKLNIQQALPCGLLLNELITNVYKHAYNGRNEGNLCISFKEKGGQVELIIQDDGKGFSFEDEEAKDSLGTNLIDTLADQLGGTIKRKNKPGAFIKLVFDKHK